MREQSPKQTAQSHWRESPHLSFTQKPLPIEGDPVTEADFRRALIYLETITEHLIEFGPVEEREAWEVSYELSHHNAWHQWEIEQEWKSGERTGEYREISLQNLYALSKRRLLAMAEAGKVDDASAFVDQLIEQAVAEEDAFERLMTPVPPGASSDKLVGGKCRS